MLLFGAVCCRNGTRSSSSFSFRSSYETGLRTMTQVATPDSVMGNFKDQAVTFNGRTYQMTVQRPT